MIDNQKELERTSDYTEETANIPNPTAPGNETSGESPLESLETTSSDEVQNEANVTDGELPEEEMTIEEYQETTSALQQEVERLHNQLQQQQQQHDAVKNQYLRTVADFDNYRKRTRKEKEDLEQQIKKNTLSELLPVVDSFERAKNHIKPKNDGEATICQSYKGIYKQLAESLKRLGVAPMRAEGEEFDPNLHEAMLREPTSEHPEGTVIEQLQRGYMIGDRVLRHAMVKVAAPPVEGETPTEEETTPAETSEAS